MNCFEITSIKGMNGEVTEIIDLGDSFDRKLKEITSITIRFGEEFNRLIDFSALCKCFEKKTLSKL